MTNEADRNDGHRIPTATIPMPQRQRPQTPPSPQASPQTMMSARREEAPRNISTLHPAVVEQATFYSSMLEENEQLRADLRRARSDLEMAREDLDQWRHRAEEARSAREKYQRIVHSQAADFDVVVRTVIAARDRMAHRLEQ